MEREHVVLHNKVNVISKKKRKVGMKQLSPWLFLLPSIIILGTFLVFPILEAFKWSLLDYKIIAGTGEYVGLANFKELFGDKNFWTALVNTLVFLVIVLPLNVFCQ
ncbi:carbohydrate ABC transporter permease [Priestia flexa]